MMIINNFNKKTNNPVVICLGGFDSIHRGHKKIILRANEIKLKYNASVCVFTFDEFPTTLYGKEKGVVFTYEERIKRFSSLPVDELCVASFTREFASLSPEQFLDELFDNRHISALLCGNDYTFGKNAIGNIGYLTEYCNGKNITLDIVDYARDCNGNKISTSSIKALLRAGDIKSVNYLLGDEYFVSGEVVYGRQVGRNLGFPTANIKCAKDKLLIKEGVYATHVVIDGVRYNAITNVGCAPTFAVEQFSIETYIDGFSGNLYGLVLSVYFDDYIREIKQFHTVDELKKQLQEDLKVIK